MAIGPLISQISFDEYDPEMLGGISIYRCRPIRPDLFDRQGPGSGPFERGA